MAQRHIHKTDQAKRHAHIGSRALACTLIAASVLTAFFGLIYATVPLSAQEFQWPWQYEKQRPVPREPVYRDPPPRNAPPVYQDDGGYQDGGGRAWPARSPICLELEKRLVQEGQFGNISQQKLPAIRAEMKKLDNQLHASQNKLDKMGCYEYFLFTKTLRRTKRCMRLARTVEKSRRRLADLEAERLRLSNSNRHSRKDEIVRELARNQCGEAYTQEARRRNTNPFASLWQDQDSGGSGYANDYNRLPFATYRTLCVRLCDGYYFPVSFSTLPAHFERDAAKCQSKCVAPTELFYHQNPGAGIDDMVAYSTNKRYTDLKSAFRYRKEYVQGCSCKQAEYVPQTPGPQSPGKSQQGAVEPTPQNQPNTTAQGPAPRPFSPTR